MRPKVAELLTKLESMINKIEVETKSTKYIKKVDKPEEPKYIISTNPST